MKSIIFVTIALFAIQINCRAIDDDIMDNSIQPDDSSSSNDNKVEQEWIKLVKSSPTKLIHQQGSLTELECQIMGSPMPSVEWIAGNVAISEMDNYISNSIQEVKSTAIIELRSVLLIDDEELKKETTYTCIGKAGDKIVTATTVVYPSANLKVQKNFAELLQLAKKKPRITYSYSFYLDILGSSLIIPCNVSGHPRTEIYWIDNNNQIVGKNSRIKVLPTNELLITDLKWEDMGRFRCVARNSFGKDKAETFIYPALKDEQ